MKLIVCLNVFLEEPLLPDCLRSIRSNLPDSPIVLVDGAYKAWMEEVRVLAAHHFEYGDEVLGNALLRFAVPASTDRTLEIAKEFGVEHIVEAPIDSAGQRQPWENEFTKRDQFFRFGEPGDWIFIVDADERLEGKPILGNEDAYTILLKRDDDINPYPVLRFYRYKAGIRFFGAHHAVWVGDRLYKRDDFPLADGCMIRHHWTERARLDPVRHQAKGAYYRRILQKDERVFRDTHGI